MRTGRRPVVDRLDFGHPPECVQHPQLRDRRHRADRDRQRDDVPVVGTAQRELDQQHPPQVRRVVSSNCQKRVAGIPA